MSPERLEPARVMFVYWGRRGITEFVLRAGQAAIADPSLQATLSVSRQNERFHEFEPFGQALFPVETFDTSAGAFTQAWRLPALRERLREQLASRRIELVVELMPHIWSPFVGKTIRESGARHAVIVHDAIPHLGDYRTRFARTFLEAAARRANVIFTLSETVSNQLRAAGTMPADRIKTLFLPDFTTPVHLLRKPPDAGLPWRLLFLGRIMPYKGLPLFVDAAEALRSRGFPIEISVMGEGPLGAEAERLQTFGARIVNRWLSDDEIAAALADHHVMVLSHVAASQSGVASMALAVGLPVVTTPVGGLVGQVIDGGTGIAADRADGPSLAAAISKLISDEQLYRDVCRRIVETARSRSMEVFIKACVSNALPGRLAPLSVMDPSE